MINMHIYSTRVIQISLNCKEANMYIKKRTFVETYFARYRFSSAIHLGTTAGLVSKIKHVMMEIYKK